MKKVSFLVLASFYTLGAYAQTSTSRFAELGNSFKEPESLASCIMENWANSKQRNILRENLTADNKAFVIRYTDNPLGPVFKIIPSSDETKKKDKQINSSLLVQSDNAQVLNQDGDVIEMAKTCL